MTRTGFLVILGVLSILGTLFLQQTLGVHQLLELGVTLTLVFVLMLAVIGGWLSASWSWPLSILFFAASIANLTMIYMTSREGFLPYLLILAWNVVGLMVSSLKSHKSALEAYSEMPPMQLENIMPVPKRASKRAKKSRRRGK